MRGGSRGETKLRKLQISVFLSSRFRRRRRFVCESRVAATTTGTGTRTTRSHELRMQIAVRRIPRSPRDCRYTRSSRNIARARSNCPLRRSVALRFSECFSSLSLCHRPVADASSRIPREFLGAAERSRDARRGAVAVCRVSSFVRFLVSASLRENRADFQPRAERSRESGLEITHS